MLVLSCLVSVCSPVCLKTPHWTRIHCLNLWWHNSLTHMCITNTLKLKGNGRYLYTGIIKCIFIINIYKFLSKCPLEFVPGVILTISQRWFSLSPVQHQAITWSNVDADLKCHMLSLGYNELKKKGILKKKNGSIKVEEKVESINSLALGRYWCDLKSVIFKLLSKMDSLSIFCQITLRWMPQDRFDD